MKKLAILLSLVMVLGMAVSAAAADVTGSVKYEMKKLGDADATWTPTWELAVNEVVEGATANIEFGTADVDAGSETVPAVVVNYAWVDFADEACPVDVSFGLFDWNDSDVEGIAAKYVVDAFTLSGVYQPEEDEALGFYGKYAPTFGAVAVEATAKVLNDSNTFTGKGTYTIVEGTKVWAKASKTDDADVVFTAGGETKFEGITLKAEYTKDETIKASASKTVKGVELGASYETTDDATMKVYGKVAF